METLFIHVGQIHVSPTPLQIMTVLGSCVAVCLYDSTRAIAGMNHYLLPLWNNNGLQTPKFGNIAIVKLIEEMVAVGANPRTIQAKIFGGANMNFTANDTMLIGQRNILIAKEILSQYNIPIVASDVGGNNGRKITLNTTTGKVTLKYASNSSQGGK